MSSNGPQILRPKPRRPFNHIATPRDASSPLLSPTLPNDMDTTPSRTHSILNLTSSTLLGIYSPSGYQSDPDEPSNPWGTGSAPSQVKRRKSIASPPTPSTSAALFSLALRSTLLFALGMLYGLLVRHLHDDRQLAPFQVEGIIKPSRDWRYLVFWGVSGVALGTLLPWIDTFWDDTLHSERSVGSCNERTSSPEIDEEEFDSSGIFGADWTPVIRSVGAFVGIAFAIRKLPWASTLQVSLTLALVNPVLWYIIDRSKPGFVLSSAVGATGTALLLVANPDMMPSPASTLRNSTIEHHAIDDWGLGFGRYVSRESIEGGIWILSVLFCSCVCFGNIGRRLALNRGMEQFAVSRGNAKATKAKQNGNGRKGGRETTERS